jgi:hypothetical protein
MEIITMNLKTAIAIAAAAAFAVPLAASAQADKTKDRPASSAGAPITSGGNAADRPANTPKAETGATAKSGGFAAVDKNKDGHISRDEARDAPWENRFSELDKDNDNRLSQTEFEAMQAGAGASAKPSAPLTGGSNAADRKPNTPKQ